MKSHALLLWLALPIVLSACTTEHDYAVIVRWTVNGMVPNQALCDEQGIARGRFEVSDRRGKHLKTLEADCDSEVFVFEEELNQEVLYGGFETNYAFDWETEYHFKLTMVDAAGNPRADSLLGEFFLPYNSYEYVALQPLEYFAPQGTRAALTAEWRIGTGDVATACAAQSIGTVKILITTATDVDFAYPEEFASAPCADGIYRSNGKVLGTGAYLFRYEAISTAGASVELGDPIPATVDGTRDIVLPRENFLTN